MARHYRRVPFKVCGRAAEDEESGVSTRGSVQCMLQQDCSLPRPRRACKQEAATRNIFVDGRRLCRRREEGAEHLFGQWRLHGGRNFRKLSALRRVPPRFTITHRAGARLRLRIFPGGRLAVHSSRDPAGVTVFRYRVVFARLAETPTIRSSTMHYSTRSTRRQPAGRRPRPTASSPAQTQQASVISRPSHAFRSRALPSPSRLHRSTRRLI